LAPADHVALLDQHVTYLEQVKNRLDQMDWCDNSGINMRLPYLIERFHFTHVFHYPYLDWEHLADIDRRLAHLNCKVIVLTIDGSAFEECVILNRTAGWRDYVRRFGETHREIVEHYARQQERLLELCARTSLELLMLDTTYQGEEETLRQALDFWGAV
jgi:hypothetical protein